MRLAGECVLVKEDGVWTATFPQHRGITTSGKTRDEAIRNAQEILELEAADLVDEGARAPRMAHVAEVIVLCANVSEEDAERMRYITKAQAADRLDVSRPRITALVAAGALEAKAFDGRELVSVESVDRYLRSDRSAGRPRKAS